MTGALPPALLAAALAFALAFATWRIIGLALAMFAVTAVAVSLSPIGETSRALVFVGLWASIIVTAAAVHLSRPAPAWRSLVLAVNAGAWAGATLSVAGTPGDLPRAMPVALLALPAAWLVGRGGGLAVKVVASWLIAVAILAATLPMIATPGFAPDHLG